MVIAIFGESCTGKSTIAAELACRTGCTVYTGKDYVKLAKNEDEAKRIFISLLCDAQSNDGIAVYVISEIPHLQLLPSGCKRVLVCADLDTIKERFAKRIGGNLPPPVAAMLEKKHGIFDSLPYDLRINHPFDVVSVCDDVLSM